MIASECQQSEVGNKTKGLNEILQMNEGDHCDCLLMIMEKAMRGKFKKMIVQQKNCARGLKKRHASMQKKGSWQFRKRSQTM